MAVPSARSMFVLLLSASIAVSVGGCASLGSVMSPYSEKFSCKNDDHGQCIHPDKAYADALAGVPSKSVSSVTNGRTASREQVNRRQIRRRQTEDSDGFGSYKASVYRELRSLIETPSAPMLQPARTVRTLILPYADRQRPDRLYMPRYVYSVLDKPAWVIGDALVETSDRGMAAPVLGQIRERHDSEGPADPPIPMTPGATAQVAKETNHER